MKKQVLGILFTLSWFVFSNLAASDIDLLASHQDIALYEKVFKEHVRLLGNIHKKHEPGMIAFSSVPGMGKTRIAKHLANRLEAIRLSSEEIRALLKRHHVNPEKRDEPTHQREMDHYLEYCLARLDAAYPNKLYILDMSIDRTFKGIKTLAEQKKVPLFVIRIAVSPEVVERRLKSREGEKSGFYLKYMERWYKDYEAFAKSYSWDYTFNNNDEMASDNISNLVIAIEEKFSK